MPEKGRKTLRIFSAVFPRGAHDEPIICIVGLRLISEEHMVATLGVLIYFGNRGATRASRRVMARHDEYQLLRFLRGLDRPRGSRRPDVDLGASPAKASPQEAAPAVRLHVVGGQDTPSPTRRLSRVSNNRTRVCRSSMDGTKVGSLRAIGVSGISNAKSIERILTDGQQDSFDLVRGARLVSRGYRGPSLRKQCRAGHFSFRLNLVQLPANDFRHSIRKSIIRNKKVHNRLTRGDVATVCNHSVHEPLKPSLMFNADRRDGRPFVPMRTTL
jgi:hypothetical protein